MLFHRWSLALVSLCLGSAVGSPYVYHRRPQLQQYLGSETSQDPPAPTDAYDYVVVGGGVTGLIAAARLADASYSVAIVESGGYPEDTTGNLTEVPAYDELWDSPPNHPVRDDSEYWWEVPVPATPESEARTLNFTGGKMIGGSHAYSYFGYLEPTVGAMQKWADEVGDQSWTYPNTKKYFDKAVSFTPPNATTRLANATPEYDTSRTGSGPLEVTYPRWAHPFNTWVAKACDALGLSHTRSFANGELLGSSWILATINSTDGTRATTWTAYHKSQPPKKKLDIFTYTLGKKILFEGKTATGVSVTRKSPKSDAESFTIKAKNEVLLAGGGVLSPQLLMVSGVGPADQLEEMGITPVLERSGVGLNFHDHIVFPVVYKVKTPTTSILQDDETRWYYEELFRTNVTGMLTNHGPDFGIVVDIPPDLRNFSQATKDHLATMPKDWPDLVIFSGPLGQNLPKDGNYATLQGIPMAALSTGKITLASADMDDKPNVIPNWLTSQVDVEIAIASLKFLRRVFENPAMAEIIDGDEVSPGPEAVTWPELEGAIRSGFRSMHHPVGTLRMGRTDDPDAVVDSEGNVIGLDNVRVVDTSGFPFMPPGSPLPVAFMFAEKITDNIINGQKQKGHGGKGRTDL
ncbi:hypothetical protein ABHI18_000964 [Aspergillus niger]